MSHLKQIINTTARRSICFCKSVTHPQPSSFNDICLKDEQLDDILFLKSAWPDMKCNEPKITKYAYQCAEALLGMEAWSVMDHLSVIINS